MTLLVCFEADPLFEASVTLRDTIVEKEVQCHVVSRDFCDTVFTTI